MKKLLVLLTMGFAVMAEPLIAHFKTAHSDSLFIARAEDAIKSREVNPKNFDFGAFSRGEINVQEWTPDSLSQDAENGSIEQLNYAANGMYQLKLEDHLDILSSLINEDEVEYVLNQDQSMIYLKLFNQSNESYYYSSYYLHSKPIIYFDSSLSGKQNLSMYMDIGWSMEDFTNLKKAIPTLVGSLPLIVMNDYTFLKVEFNETGWALKTDNYARIDPVKRDPIFTTEASPKLLMKLTIPYLDSITDIKVFSSVYTYYEDSAKNEPFQTKNIFFRFDQSLHDRYYFYLFDICSLSVLRKELIVDNSTYYSYHHTDGTQHDEMVAQFASMKVLFTGTKKERNTAIIKSLARPEIDPFLYTPILPREIESTFDPSIGYVDGKVRYWYFDEFDLDENVSGEFKILSITFHPYIKDPNTNQYYVDENTNLTHHYENANIHKYSFDVDRGIRTYYYNMTSYFRKYSDNFDYDPGPDQAGLNWNYISGFICFGFEFYFDKARRNPIPNVKNITIKYQCGYAKPNPEEGSNGFYPNGNDPKKNVRVRTMEVNENHVRGIGALDDEGMCLTDNAPKKMMVDDNKLKHDYVIYKFRKRGADPGITTMDALEIRYETAPGEMVRMVGNSKGLHVVVDEDGIARVYNSEGNLEKDYGVYESADGTLVPGKDLNGDGKIDSDEVINSDTGIKNYAPFEDDSSWFQTLIDSIGDFFSKQKARIISVLIVFGLVVVAVIFVPKLFVGKRKKH